MQATRSATDGILVTTGCRGAIGQCAIDENGVGAVIVGNRDLRLIELIIVAVTNQFVQSRGAVVVVASALHRGVAGALDRLCLVPPAAVVVEGVRVIVRVHVGAMEPEAGPE